MKIGLIYTGITESGFNSLKGNEGSWMNHGLAILSSAAKQAGHDVRLFDLRRLTGWDHYRQMIETSDANAFGLTMMSVDFNNVVKAATIIKEVKPSAPTITGGPHPSICPEEMEPLACFNYIVKGEGEITFPRLIASIERGEQMPRILQGERLDNLDNAPWADRDLFGSPEEPFVPFLRPPFVTLIAGRGCKYNCNYCQPSERIMFGHRVRRRSVQNVVDELKSLHNKFKFNSFMIHDDCITEDRDWVMAFCDRIKKEGFKQPFVAQSRADIICRNPDMIKLMHDAGLRLMIVGFESGSDRVLRFLRKGCTRAQNLEAAKILNDNGIKIWANYMMGLPTETNDEVNETYTMLQEIKPYHCSPAFYTPHPGSELFTYGQEQGIHLIASHESYRRNTYEPKIIGPDYEFLKDMLFRSIALAEKTATTEVGHNLRVFLMSNFTGFYRFLRSARNQVRDVIRQK